ncbi:MAG: hypothetical protein GY868_00090 [Deltaproteobacteria bacterium]|nr:hypothetical protein [Deltaproteobacteria bacterium]
MMRLVVVVSVMFFFSACSGILPKATDRQAAPPKVSGRVDKKAVQKQKLEQVVADALPLIRNLLRSIKELDFEANRKDFNDTMLSAYADKDLFLKINRERLEKYGEPLAHPVLRINERPPFFELTYLVKFSKLEKPVPVLMIVEKKEGRMKIAFLQYRFKYALQAK